MGVPASVTCAARLPRTPPTAIPRQPRQVQPARDRFQTSANPPRTPPCPFGRRAEEGRGPFNPVIRPLGPRVTGPEGCLSFPEIYGDVERPAEVEVSAVNEQ
ncbi:MAG: peptide deformylase, partial [Verrucomicrobiota bacterium]